MCSSVTIVLVYYFFSNLFLISPLRSDIEKIQAGIGDRVVVFLQNISTFLAGYIIAFIFGWKLALVVTSLLPFIAILTCIYAKVKPAP